MAQKRKNSNYVTEKTLAAKKAQEAFERKKKIKKILTPILISFCAVVLIVATVFAIGVPQGMLDYKATATEHVTMYIDGYDKAIHIEIYGNDAPETAKRFTSTVSASTLNNSSFLSVKDGLVYFGSATADAGASGITGEFKDNGVDNKISFRKGVIGIARGEAPNSGYGQFFIATKNSTDLNGKYAAFAKITSGIDIIESVIKNAEIDENGNIISAAKITSVSSHSADSH